MKYNNTVVLMWNPAISSVKLEDYAQWFDGLCTFKESIHNWSVYDYDKVGYGDRFLLVRVGDEQAGLVAAGMIPSDCYEGADWAGSDRKRYYADLVPMIAFNPAANAVYPTREQLQGTVPDFDWSGGHSGRVLTAAQAYKLDEFLDDFTRWKKDNGNDPGKMRVRDYAACTGKIHPTQEDRELIPNENPCPFIEAMIEQATGHQARNLEPKWEEHANRWVRGHESLLQAAAWMAYHERHKLPYYGALCLKIAHCYLGDDKYSLNAAYAKEAADFVSTPSLRKDAVMSWLYYSLKSHAEWGTGHAIDPLISPQITGLNLLSDFLGYDPCEADCMLHDYYVRKVVVNTEEDFIDISVSCDPEGTEEDILTFHLTGDIEIDAKLDSDLLPFIYEAQIGPWTGDRLQIAIQGCGLRARAERLEISLVSAD